MPRQKLSEFAAKHLLNTALDQPYNGWQIDAEQPLQEQLDMIPSSDKSYVVKVDEAIKGRFKKGLVLLDVAFNDLAQSIQTLTAKGFRWILVEPQLSHDRQDERYVSFQSDRNGTLLRFSDKGGVDIEDNQDSITEIRIDDTSTYDWGKPHISGISSTQLKVLVMTFINSYAVFLEINPYVFTDNELILLDAAIEVDDAGAYFVRNWHPRDFRRHSDTPLTNQEKQVIELDENSPASFKLSVLEPNGSIFLLLSGGGASVVVADEVYNQGFGKQLANYGEYSGNPNTEETYLYTKALFELLLASNAHQKVLFLGGAVANFTDVAKTFAGIIQAITEVKDELHEQGLKIFVRRGGPNQEAGLKKIEAVLKQYDLFGAVHGPEIPLTAAVTEALQGIEK